MLQDVLQKVQAIDSRIRATGSVSWYRGQCRSDWGLISALHRHIERLTGGIAEMSGADKRSLLREEYKTIYRRFKAEAWPLLRHEERTDWGVVFSMQHYGLPTRLLDWTESFACALFFANLKRKPDDTAAVWVLDSQALNRAVSADMDGLVALDPEAGQGQIDTRDWHPRWKPPSEDLVTLAVLPTFTNQRMVAQRSVFVLTGDSFLSLDEQFGGHLTQNGHLTKIELPPGTMGPIDDYLRVAGLSALTYFPDLWGLALAHELRVEESIRDMSRLYPNLMKRG